MSVIYTLTEENELRLEYHAKTDQATPICLTNHSYFNLAGEDSGPVDEQTIQIFSDQYVPTDEFLTLLGASLSVFFVQPHSFSSVIFFISDSPIFTSVAFLHFIIVSHIFTVEHIDNANLREFVWVLRRTQFVK